MISINGIELQGAIPSTVKGWQGIVKYGMLLASWASHPGNRRT
jgi:hypothetical protein